MLKDKNVLIAGASEGIGASIAKVLAQEGADLILIARRQKPLEKLRSQLQKQYPHQKFYILSADLSDHKKVRKVFQKISGSISKLQGLVNNVGYSRPQYFEKTPIHEFEDHISTNYLSAVFCTWEALPYLEDGAFITFTSSVAGYMGVFGFSAYSGAKFALFGFAETIEQELYSRKIKVSVLCPPDTQTPGFEKESKTKPYESKKISEGASLMHPDDVAKKFLRGLKKNKFLIVCNFQSWLYYRLHALFPGLVRFTMRYLTNHYSKKANKKYSK